MKRLSFFLGLAISVGLVLSICATKSRAQTASSGSVTGQVTDPQGAVVAGADVALLDATTNTTRAAVTNDGGRYSFPVVQPGLYDMAGNVISYIQNFTGTGGTQLSGMPSGVVFTPIESVEEFRVNTFGQTADFNGSSGAEVKMVTKRGTDKFHGAGYGFYFAPNIL